MDNWTCIGNIGRGGFGNVQLFQNKVRYNNRLINTIIDFWVFPNLFKNYIRNT